MTQNKDHQTENPTEQEDKGSDSATHAWGTGKGEEAASRQGKEAGREDTGTDDSGRPTHKRTARDSTSVNPDAEEPISDKMPNMPPA